MDISIIIPSHNRAGLVAQAVRSALAQAYPDDRYEIIVVDNASSDATPQMVRTLQQSTGSRLRYVREERLGLHHARHAGARLARGQILLFTDDDATFDPGWLQAYGTAFAQNAEMMAAGGPVRPIWEMPPPQWLVDFIGDARLFGPLSLMDPHDEFRLGPEGFFWGVNMAIRRDVLFEVGGFNPESFGDVWLGDGESGLNRKLWKRKMLIGYVPGAIVYHHIPARRMTVDYFRHRMANEGASEVYASFHKSAPDRVQLAKDIASVVIRNSKYWAGALLFRGQTDARSLRVQLRAARTQSQVRYMVGLLLDNDFRRFVLRDDWLNETCASPSSLC